MLIVTSGNLLEAEVDALVNTVNCVGYMGRGIALQFKQAFPNNFRVYERACKAKTVVPGAMLIYATGSIVGPKYIVNFPTKRHWRGNSRIEDIQAGLVALVKEVRRLGIGSIAVPPLGCGLGGLKWHDVLPRIVTAFDALPDTRVLLYPPTGAPDAKAMPVRTKKARMTHARALLVTLMDRYSDSGYRRTLLEVQKLAYFLQESAGEPLSLKYEAGLYGPYADNLNKVLQVIEGHFTRGYGDSPNPDNDIELLAGATEAAHAALDPISASYQRLQVVTDLIDGFETPYGMELLSSVHWVAHRAEAPATSAESAIEAVHAWNDRKRRILKPEHIRVAWRHLERLEAL